MKLDKMQFAKMLVYVAGIVQRNNLDSTDIQVLDDIIDIEVPEPQGAIELYPKNENVERLMKHMAGGTNKIDAIREHRAITGMGIKDSKDTVERYWNAKMSAQQFKDNQLGELQRIIDDCSPALSQFNETEIEAIKKWVEGLPA